MNELDLNKTNEEAGKDVTIAICTWNRSDSLARTLHSLTMMHKPSGLNWEVLVVNNNSTDETDEIIRSFEHELPIKRIFESKPGLSNARNAAVAAARGNYIIWTDDDVVVDERWMIAYLAAFDRYHDAALFGGPIRAVFDGDQPEWLNKGWRSVANAFCHNDLGNIPVTFSHKEPNRVPFGANFAIRSIEQKRSFYAAELGASPTGNYMGEETSLIRNVLREGATGIWVPEASVKHINSKDRMTLKYLQNYYEKDGQTRAFLSTPDYGYKLFGKPRWLWRQFVQTKLEYLWARAFCDPSEWLDKFAEHAIVCGIFKELSRNERGSTK